MVKEWRHLRINRDVGIVEVTVHGDGGPFHWTGRAGVELNQFFKQLAADDDAKVLILTGTGNAFCETSATFDFSRIRWRDVWQGQRAMLGGLLDLNIVVIAAVNGAAHYHPEIPLLADIVLACPEATFAELGHWPVGMVPGDGAQLVMRNRIGPAATRAFYLDERRVSAAEGARLGFVHEVLPRADLLARARELASAFAQRPKALLTFTKAALRMRERRHFHDDLSFSMSLEGLAVAAASAAQ